MPITKGKFKEQYEKSLARVAQLTKMGKTEQEFEEILANEKYYASVLSKIFHKSGKCITRKVKAEDVTLAKQIFAERQDSRKPVRQKEIEDAAWFHNLLHDLGKYVYHKMVQFVDWTDQDMNDYEKARTKICSFIDTIHTLIKDGEKVQRLEDEKTLLEMNLIKYQYVLDIAVKRVQMLKRYNDILISYMTPERRLRALNQMLVASTMKDMSDSMAQA
jgi:hypothetical protein